MSKCVKTILLVEDNPDDEELARLAFAENRLDGELVVMRDGQEALDYLLAAGEYAGRDANEQPRLVLLDLNIPKISGLEVLRRIRADERTRLQPVVVLTSSKEERDLVASYSLGANSYIRKPLDYGSFVEAVHSVSQYWLTLNESLQSC
ncbi:MAG: response regulator [Gallionellaceae bacterium]|nr:response regulator [Gallionellaceae bacterium]